MYPSWWLYIFTSVRVLFLVHAISTSSYCDKTFASGSKIMATYCSLIYILDQENSYVELFALACLIIHFAL